ncbi:hypothetical protein EC880221_4100, partial [Escherichia coli 88.0221]
SPVPYSEHNQPIAYDYQPVLNHS